MTWRGRRRGGGDGRDIGQGLAIEGVRQDGLHGVVAILADGEGTGAGRVQPGGSVAVAQAQDPLGAAEPIQGAIAEQMLAEQMLDEVATGRPDLGRAGATPGRRLHEEVDLVRRQVGRD